jgi:hypothetical protein
VKRGERREISGLSVRWSWKKSANIIDVKGFCHEFSIEGIVEHWIIHQLLIVISWTSIRNQTIIKRMCIQFSQKKIKLGYEKKEQKENEEYNDMSSVSSR